MIWHIITGEYPPRPGGVSDYCFLLASALARAGDSVHVWCPPLAAPAPVADGVTVHAELGRITRGDLSRVGKALDAWPGPRRLLVQWVPHAFGQRALNLGFCSWLWRRARCRGDELEIMVHEPFLSFIRGKPKHNTAAIIQRLMTMVLLNGADRVWVAAPLWEVWWRPFTWRRGLPFEWLPIPSNVPVVDAGQEVARMKRRYGRGSGKLLGHFGTYGPDIRNTLAGILPSLLQNDPERTVMLLGRGGPRFREELLRDHPHLADRIHAPGGMTPHRLSVSLQAVDLMVQPYPGGVNARRGSLMAALAHGIPVVSTRGRLTESIWAARGALHLAPDGDAAALIRAVEQLLDDPADRAGTALNGRTLYDERFALSASIERLRAARVESCHREARALVASCDSRS